MKLTDTAQTILEARYFVGKEETWDELCTRVASAISNYEVEEATWFHKFYDILHTQKFLPNSPCLMNAGTDIGQLCACFVLPVEDSMEGIFESIKNAALVNKTGGGTGFSFSRLRPKNSTVKSTNGVASGPVSFIKVFNAATEAVKQGGRRRGANLGALRIDHPDVIEFIKAKEVEGELSNFNLSVAVTDEFMKAVKNKDEEFNLIDPNTKEIVETINPVELWDMIIDKAHNNGEPGILFIDTANKYNPTPWLGDFEATNPCGEQWLLPYEACLTADTLVSTDEGVALIGSGDLVGNTLVIGTDNKAHQYRKVVSRGIKNIIEVKLGNNRTIKCTPDHKLQLVNGDFIEAKDALGEKIHILHGGPHHTVEGGYTRLHEMLGWIHGDGWFSNTLGISFNNQDGDFEFRDNIIEDFMNVFGVTNKPLKDDEVSFQLQTDKTYCLEMAEHFGIVKGSHSDKCFPSRFWEWDDREQRSFIRGLFSADASIGGASKSQIHFATSSEILASQVQNYLGAIGIHSSVYKTEFKTAKRKPQYRLTITKESANIYMDIIGFLGSKKTDKFIRGTYKDAKYFEVTEITKVGEEEVFDIVEVDGINTFYANGVGVHNCNLGSINLGLFVNENGKIDYDELERVTRIAVRFMDNVVDVSTFPIPEIEEATRKTRKLGLGIMGLHDMLIQMKTPYDSNEGRRLAARVMEAVRNIAEDESRSLSNEKGFCPAYDMKEAGLFTPRNAALTSIQPTGTVSMIADCSSGCEPYFSVVTKKTVMDGKEFVLVNKHFERIAKEEDWYSDELMNKVAESGTVVGHDEVPREWQNIFKCAQDISVDGHIRMQAVLQPYVDASISKTINMPNSASVEDVKEAYSLGWELGCKGLTVYRDGSRDVQVLTSGSTKKEETVATNGKCSKAELPDTLNSKRFRLRGKDNESVYVIICYDDYDEPLEVFAKFPYENQPDLLEKRVLWTTVCRLISLALRYGIPSTEVIKQLNKSSGVINDLPAQLSKLLTAFEVEKIEVANCPECDFGKVIFEEGCMRCDSCGWSKCG